MFRSRFFWKLYATSASLVVLTAAAIGVLTLGQLEDALLHEKETSLRHQCLRLAPLAVEQLAARDRAAAGRAVRSVAGDADTRITLIATDGSVLADTAEDPADMDNHLGREEVQVALAEGFGVARRPSKTVQRDMFYVAYAPLLESGEPAGVVRLALATDDIHEQLQASRGRLLIGTGLGVLAALALGAYVARRMTSPLAHMRRAAEQLSAGKYDTRVHDLPSDEIGVLGEALNRLAEEQSRRIGELSGEGARLRAMLAGMVEGVIAVDEQDRVSFSNSAVRKLLGTPTLDGQPLWESVRIAELDALLSEARGSDAAARRELSFADEAGREVTLRAQAHRFVISEGHVGVVIVFHDITELRRLERIRRDFVANVSHELKTPLTSIRGYVETLLSGALHDQEKNVRFLGKVDENVKRLNHLVSDLLSLARIEDQDTGLELERLNARPLLDEALRLHEPSAAGKSIACEIEAREGPLPVFGDRESLVQVIDNLVDNAIKYTPDGGRVTLAVYEEDGRAVLEVRDTGIGIPAEDLERVFERFYRVDKARSRAVGGTGLGLAIVKHLVQAMGGEVSVESTFGEGTTLRVRFAPFRGMHQD